MVERMGNPHRRDFLRGALATGVALALDGAHSNLLAQVLDPVLGSVHIPEATRLISGYFLDKEKKGLAFLQSIKEFPSLQKAFIDAIGKSIQSVFTRTGNKDIKQALVDEDELVALSFSHLPEAYKNHNCTAALSPDQLKQGEVVLRELAQYITSEIARTTSI